MPKIKHANAFSLLSLIALLTACNYTIRIKDGRTAYERKQYATAIPMLEKEFGRAKTRTEKGQLAYQIADAYRQNGRDEASLNWFSQAYENNYGPEALKGKAYALKKLERYAEARAVFKDLGIEIGRCHEATRSHPHSRSAQPLASSIIV